MIPAGLTAYALLVAFGLPRPLVGASWTSRAPRLAISMWLAAAASVVATLILAPLLLIVPNHALGDLLVLLVQWCGWADHQLPVPTWTAPQAAGVAGILGVMARLGHAIAAVTLTQRRIRHRTHRDIRLAGRFHPTLDVVVLDHPQPSAFCLPGRDATVVLTAGALRTLPAAELRAVIAHERTHLRGRHHLILTGAAILDRAFGPVSLFEDMHGELRRLVELAADDGATRHCPRHTVAHAVLRLAAPPASALGMGSTAVHQRVLRLLTAQAPLGGPAVAARALLIAALLLTPLTVITMPALSDLGYHCA
ncbi:Peptidase M48 Ste24p [Frankia canadensis]|uniref:Peptidase M48 Ste24p n=1 Tax=Frankia canadensis TaxID=1836972 RepID=A0A2I2KW64_9ACTN|nr:M56 family metallopeptidase [Frankia canadensis]SNQ49901.1 Peptidase M48 Ste24p [Frankia canadensis]SOU57191.1 Peptidase M48 Ste24p [Frankia canadensis]